MDHIEFFHCYRVVVFMLLLAVFAVLVTFCVSSLLIHRVCSLLAVFLFLLLYLPFFSVVCHRRGAVVRLCDVIYLQVAVGNLVALVGVAVVYYRHAETGGCLPLWLSVVAALAVSIGLILHQVHGTLIGIVQQYMVIFATQALIRYCCNLCTIDVSINNNQLLWWW